MLTLSLSDDGKASNNEWLILYFYLIGYLLGDLMAICVKSNNKHSKQTQHGK